METMNGFCRTVRRKQTDIIHEAHRDRRAAMLTVRARVANDRGVAEGWKVANL